MPHQMITNHGVEESQQFSHAGDDRDFIGFSGLLKPLGKTSDDGIESHGGDGGHVQDTAQSGASATDGAFAGSGSGVGVEGSDADQGADASSIGLAQFVEFGQERGAEDGPDAGDRSQELVDGVEVIVGIDELFDLAIQVIDLPVDGFQHGIDGFAGRGAGGGEAAVSLLGADVCELPSAGDQGIEFGLDFRAFFGQSRG